MTIRSATYQDASGIVALQKTNSQAAQWREPDYVRLCDDPNGTLLVAEDDTGHIVGFVAAQRGADEAELRNLAVEPERQRHGIGRALLVEVHDQLREAGVRLIHLEVRPSNQRAIGLYHAVGYVLSGRRKDYYYCPAEDALVLHRELP